MPSFFPCLASSAWSETFGEFPHIARDGKPVVGFARIGDSLQMPTKKKVTKTGFVLSLPTSLAAKDVIDKAKGAGLSLTDKAVYAIRYEARSKGKKRGRKDASAPAVGDARKAVAGRVKQAVTASHHFDAHFRKLVLDLGLGRAKTLLDEIEHKVSQIISGR